MARGHLTLRGRSIPVGRLIILPVSIAAVMTIAHECSSSASSAPRWQEATTASGNYVAMFPGEPTAETFQKSDFVVNELSSTDDRSFYGLTEMPLNGVPPDPLDVAVDNSIEGARAGREPSWGPTTKTELSRSTGDIHGTETRRYRFELTADGHKAIVESLIFYRNDVQVQGMVVSDGSANSERFLSSVRPAEPAQDEAA